jgi:DNA-binding NarL/FixJ family response regulator
MSIRTAAVLDEHPLWLESVEQALSRADIDVVAKATTPSTALKQLAEHDPDLIVTGLKTPDGEMDGIEFVRCARRDAPRTKIVVLSMYKDSQHIEAALEAGAEAYVVKTTHPDDLISAIRQAFEHSVFFATDGRSGAAAPLQPPDESLGLTRRELEILQLVAEGHSNAQVARTLWVTEQTVKFHLSNVYRKLRVANRTEASRFAQLRGLLAAPSLQANEAPALQATA